MKGVNLAILIAFIAFVIAIVSLGLEYFQVLEIHSSILNLSDSIHGNYLLNLEMV